MTTLNQKTVHCPVCGNKEMFMEMFSTHSFGSPDLDFRSAKPARDFLSMTIHRCSKCGYSASSSTFERPVSEDVKEFVLSNPDFLQKKSWRDDVAFENKAKIAVFQGDWNAAFHAYLHAAWESEPQYFDEPSRYRNEALAILKEHFAMLDIPEDSKYLVYADLCRRTGDFESVLALEYQSEDENVNRILAFQKKLAQLQDTCVYRLDTALSPEDEQNEAIRRMQNFVRVSNGLW